MSYSDPRVAFKLGAMLQSIEDRVTYSKPKIGELIRELGRLNDALGEGDRDLIDSWLEYLRAHYSGFDELDPDDKKALIEDLRALRDRVAEKMS